MSKDIFCFDKVLSILYEETNDFEIDPVLYVVKYFESLKNQVDLFKNIQIINGIHSSDKHLDSIKEIEKLEAICIENCRKNSQNFKERLKKVIEDTLELTSKPKSIVSLQRTYLIRLESIQLRKEILKQNLIFLERFDDKEIESLIVIDPFTLDDFQIEFIK